jgi:hypothetical protein
MATNPPLDYTELAQLLVRSASRKNFPALGEILAQLDPTRVDVMVMIHSASTHLTILGDYRAVALPGDPGAILGPPTIAQIAQVLEDVAR